jgi:hypothetical protein
VGGLHVALHIFKYLLVAQISLTEVFLSAGRVDSSVYPVLSATHEYVELLDTSSRCSSSILARYFIVCLQETMTIDVVLVRLQQPLTLEQNTEYLNHHEPSRLLRRLMHGQRDEAWKKQELTAPTTDDEVVDFFRDTLPPLHFPKEVALRMITHSTWKYGTRGHNYRLSFIGMQSRLV